MGFFDAAMCIVEAACGLDAVAVAMGAVAAAVVTVQEEGSCVGVLTEDGILDGGPGEVEQVVVVLGAKAVEITSIKTGCHFPAPVIYGDFASEVDSFGGHVWCIHRTWQKE